MRAEAAWPGCQAGSSPRASAALTPVPSMPIVVMLPLRTKAIFVPSDETAGLVSAAAFAVRFVWLPPEEVIE
jgi:hypothetical protein